MKKVDITNTGGHPLITENFSHLQNGVVEALAHLSLGLGYDSGPGMRLWGTAFSVSTTTAITWAAGAIYLNGEICQVPAGSATKLVGEVFKWEVYQVALPIDPQTYADAVTHDVHLENRARIVAAASLGGSDAAADCPFLIDVLQPKLEEETLPSGSFTAVDSMAAPVVITTVLRSAKWRLVNHTMTIDLDVSGTLAAAADIIYIELPDSNVAHGNYHSVVLVNEVACLLRAETGQTLLKVDSGVGADFALGAVSIRGQITLRVQ